MTPEELKAIYARLYSKQFSDDLTRAEDMSALLAYVKEDLLTKLETRTRLVEEVQVQRDELKAENERLRKAFRVLRSLAVTRMSQDGPGEYTQGREHEAEFWSDMLDAVTLKEEK